MTRGRRSGRIAVAAGVILLAGVVGWQTMVIPVSPIYATVGPTVFPGMVAGGLFLLGFGLLWQAVRGEWPSEDDTSPATDWRALGWLIGGLALNVALIQPLGFTIASTLMFTCVARAFGSARPLRDAGVGFALAVAAYLGFSRLLGISIGAGVIEAWL